MSRLCWVQHYSKWTWVTVGRKGKLARVEACTWLMRWGGDSADSARAKSIIKCPGTSSPALLWLNSLAALWLPFDGCKPEACLQNYKTFYSPMLWPLSSSCWTVAAWLYSCTKQYGAVWWSNMDIILQPSQWEFPRGTNKWPQHHITRAQRHFYCLFVLCLIVHVYPPAELPPVTTLPVPILLKKHPLLPPLLLLHILLLFLLLWKEAQKKKSIFHDAEAQAFMAIQGCVSFMSCQFHCGTLGLIQVFTHWTEALQRGHRCGWFSL